ncbi:QueT transporter family protein [Stomatobaculum longum]|jgi:predicted membrane protein|uniref:QueT transporter family protein n=1 Tax=Stomatobaculum longum TaxID=796942 RepID=UPI001CB56345|nr:QueT transporter family protein [Stomatobaculum longum]MBF1255789.1 QueT transporter family protein [Stomatobaculum longum]
MRETSLGNTRALVNAALLAAVYAALTYVTKPISFGAVQFRVSEALCILPVFTVAAVPGLFVGCFLANFLSGAAALDVIFGSLATLLGAYGTYRLRDKGYLAALPPILCNALIIPFVLRYGYGIEGFLPFFVLTVGVGEIIAVGILGNMLRLALLRYGSKLFPEGSIG